MTEATIQSKILDYIRSIGGYGIKVITATVSGNPDIICCLNGRFVAIEVKQPGKQPTELQSLKMEMIRASGGVAFVACSVADVKTALSQQFPLTGIEVMKP